ncbi:MAG: poly(R)-hydroxyalkanoic acid synthase subunit PhaE [Desulfosarcinaceae bacterium]|nr:poly(R)-hydroxyalkanoic acid synthase subunit PhaE [Desulfosarcinaceae bacterium]
MTEKNSHGTHGEELFSQWSQSMTEAWGEMLKWWTPPAAAADGKATPGASGHGGTAERMGAATEAALKNWQSIAAAMSAPESMLSLFKGVGAMPETLANLSRSTLTGYMEMQQKTLERVGKLGQHVDAYSFSDVDENLFRSWTLLYEKEFSRYFQVPALGLTREYQERAAKAADAYHRYQATLSEFLRLLALPIGRSFSVLQEKIAALAEDGDLPEEGKAYYDLWIKVLEGHYMTLFQTPEYMEALSQTLSSLAAFRSARNAVIEDLLQGLPIPTQSEIDDLYEEIHRLKRRVRDLEKQS